MDDHTVWAQAASLAQVPSEGRVAMIDTDRPGDPPVVLEGTAAAIWAQVDGRQTVAEVVEAVAGAYGVPPDDVRDDVTAFLADLATRGMVRRSEA